MTKKLNVRQDSQKLAVKNSFCYTVLIVGDMAELVDAADLKSADYYNLKGSSPFIPIENVFKKIRRSLPHQIDVLWMPIDQSIDKTPEHYRPQII